MFERKAEDAQHARESRIPSRKAALGTAERGHDVTEAPAQRTLWRASSGTDLYDVKISRARHVARAAVVTAGGVGSDSKGEGGKTVSSGDCSDPATKGKGGRKEFTHPLVENIESKIPERSRNEMSADDAPEREGNSFDHSSLVRPDVGGRVGVDSLEGTEKNETDRDEGLPPPVSKDGASLRTAQDATKAAPTALEKEDVSEQARDCSDEAGAGQIDISESRDDKPISSTSRNQRRESFAVLEEGKLRKEPVLAVATAVAADVEATSIDGKSKEPEVTDASGAVDVTAPEKKLDEGDLADRRRVTENDECSAIGMNTPESGMAPATDRVVANKLDCKSESGRNISSISRGDTCGDSTEVHEGNGRTGYAARLSPPPSPSFALSPESDAPIRREGESQDKEEGAEESTSSGTDTGTGTSRKYEEGGLQGSGMVCPIDVERGDGDNEGVDDVDGNDGQGVAERREEEVAVSCGGGDRIAVAAEEAVPLATGDVRGVDQVVERERIEKVNGNKYSSRGVDDGGMLSPSLEATSTPAITSIDSPAAESGEESQVVLSSSEDLIRTQESFAAERVASGETRMPGGGSTLDDMALPPSLLPLRGAVSVEEAVTTSAPSSLAVTTAKETFGKLQKVFSSAASDERRISDKVPTAVEQALTAAVNKDGDDKILLVARSPRSMEILSPLTPVTLKETERSLDVSIVDTPSTTGEAEEDVRQHSPGSGDIVARRSFFDSAAVGAGTASGGSGGSVGALYFASRSSSIAIDALERDDDKEEVDDDKEEMDYDKERFDDFGNKTGNGDLVVSPPSPTGSPVLSRLQPVDEKGKNQEGNDKDKNREASNVHQKQEKTWIASSSDGNTAVPPPYPENMTTTPRPRLRWPAAWSPTRVFSPSGSPSRLAWPFSGGNGGGTAYGGGGGEGIGVGEGGLQVVKPCGSPRLRVPLSPGPKSEPLSFGQWPSSRSKVKTVEVVNYFGEAKYLYYFWKGAGKGGERVE